jgi:prophage tail gpP-like protein
MPLPESKLVVRFTGLGRETANLKAWSLDSGYLTAADGFSFTLAEPDFELSRNLELQPVELVLDGNLQMVGRIDRTRRGRDGIAVTLEGRDYLAEMIECHADPSLKLKSETSLAQAIKDAAGTVGIANVEGDAGATMRKLRTGASISGGPAPPDFAALKQDEYKTKPGEGIFQFCNRLAARHGATIQPTGKRDTVALTAPDYGQDVTFVLQRHRGPTRVGNIKDGEAVRDYSSFPTVLLATGKRGAKGEPKQALFTQIQAELEDRLQDLIATDRRLPKNNPGDVAQLYRLWYMREEIARSAEQIQKAAQRAFAERFRKTLEYTCSVRGHRGDGGNDAMFAIDTLARVDDEVADVAEDMWVESVTLSWTRDSGPKTDLKLWRKSAFVI